MESNENNQLGELSPILGLIKVNDKVAAKAIIDGIKDGTVNPLQVHLALKKVSNIIDKTTGDKGDKEVKAIILAEAEKYVEKSGTFKHMGASVTVGAVYTSYDFTTCQDPYWNELDRIEKEVKKLKTERETFLKAVQGTSEKALAFKGMPVIVEVLPSFEMVDSGEEYRLYAPVKKQRMGIKVSFKDE